VERGDAEEERGDGREGGRGGPEGGESRHARFPSCGWVLAVGLP
jgi:hypothetical protein